MNASRRSGAPQGHAAVGLWRRFVTVTLDNLVWAVPSVLVLVLGQATLFGATPLPPGAGSAFLVGAVLVALTILRVNGGVLAGRGQSLGMRATGLVLVDVHRNEPVGTSRAFGYSLRNVARRVGAEPSPGESHAHAALVPFHVMLERGGRLS